MSKNLLDIYETKVPALIKVRILSSEGVLYEEDSKSLTAINEAGIFDILSGHTNFISVIKDKLTITRKDGDKVNFNIQNGIIRCKDNKVNVYIGLEDIKQAS